MQEQLTRVLQALLEGASASRLALGLGFLWLVFQGARESRAIRQSGKRGSLRVLSTLGVSRTRWRAWIEGALVIGAIYYLLSETVALLPGGRLLDFTSYYAATNVWLSGGNFYSPPALVAFGAPLGLEPPHYIYPPVTILIFVPFALLPVAQAKLLWVLVSCLFLLASGFGLFFASRRTFAHPVSPALLAWVIALQRPGRESLIYGQVGPLILMLLSFALWAWVVKRERTAGVFIALASIIKVFPIVFLLYLACRRAFRAIGMAIGVGGGLMVVGLLVGGVPALYTFFTHVLPTYSRGIPSYFNQSFNGWLRRLTATPEQIATYDVFAHADTLALRAAQLAFALVVIGLTVWAVRRDPAPSAARRAVEFALFVVTMLLTLPVVWTHYLIWLIVPLVMLLNVLASWTLQARTQAALLLGLGACWVSFQYIPNLYELPGWPPLLLSFGFYALLLLYALLWWLLARPMFRLRAAFFACPRIVAD